MNDDVCFRCGDNVLRCHCEPVVNFGAGIESAIPTTGLAQVRPRDWPTFWQSLTPEECRDALRAAPRVADKWMKIYGRSWVRFDVENGDIAARVEPRGRNRKMGALLNEEPIGKFSDENEAMTAANEALRQAGWVLLE